MFAKISTVLVALAAVAVAIPTPGGVSQCNTGPAQCCNSVQSASSSSVSGLLGLLGIPIQDVTALVGLNCLPIVRFSSLQFTLVLTSFYSSLVANGTITSHSHYRVYTNHLSSSNAEPVCCENNNFNGLINIGCSPINL